MEGKKEREGGGKEKEKERVNNPDVRETSVGCLLHVPKLGIEPAT